MRSLLDALRLEADFKHFRSSLLRIVKNLLKNPNAMKYRQISSGDAQFAFTKHEKVTAILLFLGYKLENESTFVMPLPDTGKIEALGKILQETETHAGSLFDEPKHSAGVLSSECSDEPKRMPSTETKDELFLQKLLDKDKKAIALENLVEKGDRLLDHDRRSEAFMCYQEALEGQEELCGPDDVAPLKIIARLGDLLFIDDNLEESRKYYERALAGSDRLLGPSHRFSVGLRESIENVISALAQSLPPKPVVKRPEELSTKGGPNCHNFDAVEPYPKPVTT
jgi:tetratricopeptide (TPR) repeat protein